MKTNKIPTIAKDMMARIATVEKWRALTGGGICEDARVFVVLSEVELAMASEFCGLAESISGGSNSAIIFNLSS